MQNLSDLIGKNLSSFKLETLHEVWSANEQGIPTNAIGAFKSETVAQAFAGNKTDSWGTQVLPVIVLTDGTNTFAIEKNRVVNVFDDEAEATKLRQVAIEKLSPADRKILGV
jgi:hypothetical protein